VIVDYEVTVKVRIRNVLSAGPAIDRVRDIFSGWPTKDFIITEAAVAPAQLT
jgi:hypothetical protein